MDYNDDKQGEKKRFNERIILKKKKLKIISN